jgi:hypothetical protein
MIVGWIGSANIIIAYFLLSRGKLSSDHVAYHAMNFLGAICNFSFNSYKSAWSSVFLEFTWAMIALISTIKIIKIKLEERREIIDDFGNKISPEEKNNA